MKTKDVVDLYNKYVMQTYTRIPLVIQKAKGSVVEDIDGKKYLDFFPGWAVSDGVRSTGRDKNRAGF